MPIVDYAASARTRVQTHLAAPGMEFASEMVVKATLSHQKIAEVPIVLHPDGRDRPPT